MEPLRSGLALTTGGRALARVTRGARRDSVHRVAPHWDNLDLDPGVVHLLPHQTKIARGRRFPVKMHPRLLALLKEQA